MISKKFLIYMLRWIFSGIIMSVPLYLLRIIGMVNPYVNLLLVQVIGAFIFWFIDKLIFRNKGIDKIEQVLHRYRDKNNKFLISDTRREAIIESLTFALKSLQE